MTTPPTYNPVLGNSLRRDGTICPNSSLSTVTIAGDSDCFSDKCLLAADRLESSVGPWAKSKWTTC